MKEIHNKETIIRIDNQEAIMIIILINIINTANIININTINMDNMGNTDNMDNMDNIISIINITTINTGNTINITNVMMTEMIIDSTEVDQITMSIIPMTKGQTEIIPENIINKIRFCKTI